MSVIYPASPSVNSSTLTSSLTCCLAAFFAGLLVSAGWMDLTDAGESLRSSGLFARCGVYGGVYGALPGRLASDVKPDVGLSVSIGSLHFYLALVVAPSNGARRLVQRSSGGDIRSMIALWYRLTI